MDDFKTVVDELSETHGSIGQELLKRYENLESITNRIVIGAHRIIPNVFPFVNLSPARFYEVLCMHALDSDFPVAMGILYQVESYEDIKIRCEQTFTCNSSVMHVKFFSEENKYTYGIEVSYRRKNLLYFCFARRSRWADDYQDNTISFEDIDKIPLTFAHLEKPLKLSVGEHMVGWKLQSISTEER